MDRLRRTGLGMNLHPHLSSIALSRHKRYRIGRNPNQEIRIVDDMISREHSVLNFDGQVWQVEDKKSLNKTFVNGDELVPHQVSKKCLMACT